MHYAINQVDLGLFPKIIGLDFWPLEMAYIKMRRSNTVFMFTQGNTEQYLKQGQKLSIRT